MNNDLKQKAIQTIKESDIDVVILIDDSGSSMFTQKFTPEHVVGCLTRIIHNILSNSVEYNDEGNTIDDIPPDEMPPDPFPPSLLGGRIF